MFVKPTDVCGRAERSSEEEEEETQTHVATNKKQNKSCSMVTEHLMRYCDFMMDMFVLDVTDVVVESA